EVDQVEEGGALVEDPHHDLLAVHRGERGHAEVDRLAGDDARHATVLGDAPLGDIEVGHDLEPGDQPGLNVLRRTHHLVEHTVDAVPHPDIGLGRFDVDVGRPVLHGLADQEVDQLDDRRVLGDLLDAGEVVLGLHLAGRQGGDVLGVALDALVLLDRLEDRPAGGDDRAYLGPRDRAYVVDGDDVGGVGHGHDQAVLLPPDGDGL